MRSPLQVEHTPVTTVLLHQMRQVKHSDNHKAGRGLDACHGKGIGMIYLLGDV